MLTWHSSDVQFLKNTLVSDLCCLFSSVFQSKMKQGDFWTALLQNTKKLPPRSVQQNKSILFTPIPGVIPDRYKKNTDEIFRPSVLK